MSYSPYSNEMDNTNIDPFAPNAGFWSAGQIATALAAQFPPPAVEAVLTPDSSLDPVEIPF